ncbi:MAG: leucine-rich repeat domain-containing protein [Cyanobacteria bacterium J06659_2]
MTALTNLDLGRKQITDVTPLASLTNLAWLDLNNNQITDVSALADLPNLTTLVLVDNPLNDQTCPRQPETICEFEFYNPRDALPPQSYP